MKTDRNTLHEMERLHQLWEAEVTSAQEQGRLTEKTARTYLLHSSNFLRWCKGNLSQAAGNGKL